MSADQEQIDYYAQRARTLAAAVVALLDEYEEEHPKDAPCFITVLDGMKEVAAS
jgi:hypothetical protein